MRPLPPLHPRAVAAVLLPVGAATLGLTVAARPPLVDGLVERLAARRAIR